MDVVLVILCIVVWLGFGRLSSSTIEDTFYRPLEEIPTWLHVVCMLLGFAGFFLIMVLGVSALAFYFLTWLLVTPKLWKKLTTKG